MTQQLLAMFPGQGSQFVGMGKELLNQFPTTRLVFEEAEDAARVPIRKLCFDGPEEELKLTANTQPCILTLSVAVWRVLQNETGISPTHFAGHSLGEYSALVASGRLELGRAAMLVRRRGEAMQAAVPAGTGAMAAVLNLGADLLQERCDEVRKKYAHSSDAKKSLSVEIVNFNSPGQLVIAGHATAVEALCAGLEADGVRFVMLPVSAPFHSSLMTPAHDVMEPLLRETAFAESTQHKIIANLTGKVAPDYDADYLIQQIDSPVLWMQSMETAQTAGCDAYLEVGPGKVLFGLARRCLAKGAKLMHTEDVKKTIEDLKLLPIS